MKTTISIILSLIIASSLFAQEEVYNSTTVDKMLVYPGCENGLNEPDATQETINLNLVRCFDKKINKYVSQHIKVWKLEQGKYHKAKIGFTVSAEGKIVDIQPSKGSDLEIAKQVVKALETLNERLAKQGKSIVAATKDGKNVATRFSVPVRMRYNAMRER